MRGDFALAALGREFGGNAILGAYDGSSSIYGSQHQAGSTSMCHELLG
jgi:hypothetical protein